MGIQFQQVDGLDSTFTALSGDLQGQITALDVTGMASGTFQFSGAKTFISDVSCSGEAGLGVERDNLYVYGNSFVASGMRVGRSINAIRSTTPDPDGTFQVTGGASYFEGDVNIRNAGKVVGGSIFGTGLEITGDISGTTSITSLTLYSDTGNLEHLTTVSLTATSASITSATIPTISSTTIGATTVESAVFSGTSNSTGYFENVIITGDPTGFLKLHAIPDWSETGSIPAPATGTVFRSGNYLMIV